MFVYFFISVLLVRLGDVVWQSKVVRQIIRDVGQLSDVDEDDEDPGSKGSQKAERRVRGLLSRGHISSRSEATRVLSESRKELSKPS